LDACLCQFLDYGLRKAGEVVRTKSVVVGIASALAMIVLSLGGCAKTRTTSPDRCVRESTSAPFPVNVDEHRQTFKKCIDRLLAVEMSTEDRIRLFEDAGFDCQHYTQAQAAYWYCKKVRGLGLWGVLLDWTPSDNAEAAKEIDGGFTVILP
jgi:hypothetical protein